MTWSYADKSHVSIWFIKSQNSTIRQVFDMAWYVRNFHSFKEAELPRLIDFIQNLNLNFHLAIENTENVLQNMTTTIL